MCTRVLSAVLLVSFLLLSAHSAAAQELTQQQKQELQRATKDLEKAEEAYKRDPRGSTFRFHFNNARRWLKDLPQDNAEVEKLTERLAKIDPDKPKEPPPEKKAEEKKPEEGKEEGREEPAEKKSVGPKPPEEPGPEGYDNALNALKFAFQYKNWTQQKVQEAPGFRKEKIQSALVDAASAIEAVPKGKHRDYLDWYYNWIEGRLWPGLWEKQRKVILVKKKADECYALLYRDTSKWSDGNYNNTGYDPDFVREWGEKFNKTLVILQTVRNSWDEIIEMDPEFNKSDAVRLNGRLRDMGPAAAVKQRELMAKALGNLAGRLDKTKSWMDQIKSAGHNPGQLQEHADGLQLLAEMMGAPEEIQAKHKEFAIEVRTYLAKATKEKEEALRREIEGRKAPEDLYAGSDKEDLRAKIKAEWKKLYPNDTILGVRMKSKEFQRTVKWVWSSAEKAYYKVDKSVLVCSVIVKTDDTFATIYPAYINKDNLKGTQNVGAETKGDGYVHRMMLVENFK